MPEKPALRGGLVRRVATLAALAALALPAVAAAAPQPLPYRAHDYGGFMNILPAGQGTNVNALQITTFLATGARPAVDQNQLAMYQDLMYATPGLGAKHIADYYKDASFGVPVGAAKRTYSPRNDVTLVRDGYGVPHIYGATRAGAMFGAGYAAAEDRLFFIDALRHAARAELSSFAGGSEGNREMDRSVWADTPYNESDFYKQYARADELYGARGALLQQDSVDYVAGINAFINVAKTNPLKMPGEYALTNHPLGPDPWTVNDVIALASLVAGIFGKGGGGELGNALALQTSQEQLGKRKGRRVWEDFRSFDDPEAPTTVHGQAFRYDQPPNRRRGLAMPDLGSVQFADVVQSKSGGGATPASSKFPDANGLLDPLRKLTANSNALLVSGRESESGRPVAVMGPQVAYFSPQILMEQDIHAPASDKGPPIDARGAAFPGVNLFVQLGRGQDYAWSATSAGQDIIDTFALKLCVPNGGHPTLNSNHYRFEGECLPFEVLTRTNSWTPSAADMTPPGSETLTALRSELGIVIARATIDGKPVAYTLLRDTYFHEVDPTALGFANFNNPQKMRSPKDFMQAACKIALTFNWFYIDDKHIAYFNSGQNPVRARGVDPNLPTMGTPRFMWRGFDADTDTERQTPCREHPQVVDQRFLTSWNNRQAPHYSVGWSPLFRSDMLDERIRPDIAGSKKVNLQELISDMEDAGTVDMRGDLVLPWILKVIRSKPVSDPDLRDAISTLAQWTATGAHRIDRDQNGHYDQAEAVRIMDAVWPRVVEAQFMPTLGETVFNTISWHHDAPGVLGSSFDVNNYGFVQKDLRTILGENAKGRYSRVYCGRGDLGKCRSALLSALSDALDHDSIGELYPGGGCQLGVPGFSADAQECHDAISYRAVGAVTQPLEPWVNRPTFQQAVEIHGHR